MAYLGLKSWSTTPASNATVGSISWAEGQAPSTVNDSARQTMADLAAWYQASYATFQARLTLTTATAVTTADVTGAGTLYLTPYKGNQIWLYDGSAQWNLFNLTEISLALTLTSGKPYDIFCYDNAGTPTLESLVWTNDTTRATALTLQNGIYVKTGATTRRYVGTIYASGANTTEDSFAKRYVWNMYNRVPRGMRNATETADSWGYTTAAFRQANANAANQLDCVIGVSEDLVEAEVFGRASSDQVINTVVMSVGVGVDSTTVNSAQILNALNNPLANAIVPLGAAYAGYPGAGRHTLVWLEYSTATGTTTWRGDDGKTVVQSGIKGVIPA